MGPVEREAFKWFSTISYKRVDKIVTRGYDTTELVEKGYGLADVIFIDYQARIPLVEEAKMLNYLMILCLDDGLSTPAAISRLVAKGQTLLTQAMGASILAFGHAYGAFKTHGDMLKTSMERAEKERKSLDDMAEILVQENPESLVLGVSDLMLRDPAARRTFARAEGLGVAGRHIDFQNRIVKAAQRTRSETVDLDMLGAISATMLDLGFTPEATWSIVAITRSFGCGAHAIEEVEREPQVVFGQVLQSEENYDGPPERPVPPLKDRDKVAKPAQSKGLDEWKENFEARKKLHGSGYSIVEEIEDPRKVVTRVRQ
jgi:citrate synthase